MANPKCDTLQCQRTLESFDELASSMCDKCTELLTRRHHFAVICWNCGIPTLIEAKPVQAGQVLIKDKYIMSSSCPQCQEGSDGLRYMTIRPGEKSDVVLGQGETLNLGDHGLVAGPKQAVKHRDVKETVDIDGASIIGEITISPNFHQEALERANSFLDSLKLDENYDQHSNPS